MLLEDLLLAVAIGVALLGVGVPIARFLKVARWRRPDPLAEARERLRIAKLEAEVARVNREADKIYEELYDETLGKERSGTAVRVDSEREPAREGGETAEPVEPIEQAEQTEKGKRDGHG